MTDCWYLPLATTTANAYGLDPRLVCALIHAESRGHADAFRFEPKVYQRHLSKLPAYRTMDGRRVSGVYGLMGVRYTVARTYGFTGEPERLFVPGENLHYGCRLLRDLTVWANTYDTVSQETRTKAMLAAYAGGRGGNIPGGPLRPLDEAYAHRVLAIERERLERTA